MAEAGGKIAAAMRNMELRANEIDSVSQLVPEAQKIVKMLRSRKTQSPRDAYFYIAALPPEMLAFIEVETPNPAAMSKIRAYQQKWRPMRLALPVAELDALGLPRGPKFDRVLEDLFEIQLKGRARDPESRAKALRQLAGIKEEPKKAEKEKKKRKGKEAGAAKPAEEPKAHEQAEERKHAKAASAPQKAAASAGHQAAAAPARKHVASGHSEAKGKARHAKKVGR